MTSKQSIEAFERARTWRAYIEEYGVVGGCNHVVAYAQALSEEERAYAFEMLVRNLLLTPLVFHDTPTWAPWAQGDGELTDMMRGCDNDLLPEHRYDGLHDRTRMREHYVMRRMLEEFSRSCSNAHWVDVWLSRAVDFFLHDYCHTHHYGCTTCVQYALDLMQSDGAGTEVLDRNVALLRDRCRDNHACFGFVLWCLTRLPRTAKRAVALTQFCQEHPTPLADYLQRPAHRSVIARLAECGIAGSSAAVHP